MKIKKIKIAEANQRQAEYDKLTTQQKIAKIDAKYGKGKGGKKVRAKLNRKVQV